MRRWVLVVGLVLALAALEYLLSDPFEKQITRALLSSQSELWANLVWRRVCSRPLPPLARPLIAAGILVFVIAVHAVAFLHGRHRHPFALAMLSEVYTYSKREDLRGSAFDPLNDKRFWKRLFAEAGVPTPRVYGVFRRGAYRGSRAVVGRAIWKPVQGSRGAGIHFQWPGVFEPVDGGEGPWLLEEYVEETAHLFRVVTVRRGEVFEAYKIRSDSFLTNWALGASRTTLVESPTLMYSGLEMTDPGYLRVREQARAMHARLPGIHSIGWDVLQTQRGETFFLEGNTTHAVCHSGWSGAGAVESIEECVKKYIYV